MIAVDEVSLLVEVPGDVVLGALVAELERRGLALPADDLGPHAAATVDAWLGAGAPGARDPLRDPCDHLVAGLDARLADARVLEIRPGPRRSVGPDLVALVFGQRGRFGTVVRAFLRVHRVGARIPEAPAFTGARDPELTDGERRLLDAVAATLAR